MIDILEIELIQMYVYTIYHVVPETCMSILGQVTDIAVSGLNEITPCSIQHIISFCLPPPPPPQETSITFNITPFQLSVALLMKIFCALSASVEMENFFELAFPFPLLHVAASSTRIVIFPFLLKTHSEILH